MDVAPILGVNHVKPACYVLNACDCICLLLSVILRMDFVYCKCMYVLFSSQHHRRINIS